MASRSPPKNIPIKDVFENKNEEEEEEEEEENNQIDVNINENNDEEEEEEEEEEDDSPDEIFCLICFKILPEIYVELPGCKKEIHRFCIDCADNFEHVNAGYRYYNKGNQNESIKCPICSEITQLKVTGTLSFRKRVKKYSSEDYIKNGGCPYHDDMMLLYYCNDCFEPMCFKCSNESVHSFHHFDSIDTAIHNFKDEIVQKTQYVQTIQNSIINYIANSEDIEALIVTNAKAKKDEVKTQFQILHEILDKKQMEYEEKIDLIENDKKATHESNLELCKKHSNVVNNAMDTINESVSSIDNSPLEFLTSISSESNQQLIQQISLLADENHQLFEDKYIDHFTLFPTLDSEKTIKFLDQLEYKYNNHQNNNNNNYYYKKDYNKYNY